MANLHRTRSGCIVQLVLIVLFISGVVVTFKSCSDLPEKKDLDVRVFNSGNSITLINLENFTLDKVDLELNEQYLYSAYMILPGDTLAIPKDEFSKPTGERFPDDYSINKISAYAKDTNNNILQFYSER